MKVELACDQMGLSALICDGVFCPPSSWQPTQQYGIWQNSKPSIVRLVQPSTHGFHGPIPAPTGPHGSNSILRSWSTKAFNQPMRNPLMGFVSCCPAGRMLLVRARHLVNSTAPQHAFFTLNRLLSKPSIDENPVAGNRGNSGVRPLLQRCHWLLERRYSVQLVEMDRHKLIVVLVCILQDLLTRIPNLFCPSLTSSLELCIGVHLLQALLPTLSGL